MEINILTIFPEMFNIFNYSIISRAIKNNLVKINLVNIRDFSTNKHKKVDDYPYGGGPGMVLQVEPIYNAIKSITCKTNTKVIYLGPRGQTFNQNKAKSMLKEKSITLLCGHYEGIDERCYNFIDEEISIGDFILTGGEMAAIPIIDSIVRLIPDVLNKESVEFESFNENCNLDFPQYTSPRNFMGLEVPEVLLSGNHLNINNWRNEQSLKLTKRLKPYLINKNEK